VISFKISILTSGLYKSFLWGCCEYELLTSFVQKASKQRTTWNLRWERININRLPKSKDRRTNKQKDKAVVKVKAFAKNYGAIALNVWQNNKQNNKSKYEIIIPCSWHCPRPRMIQESSLRREFRGILLGEQLYVSHGAPIVRSLETRSRLSGDPRTKDQGLSILRSPPELAHFGKRFIPAPRRFTRSPAHKS